MYNHKRKAQEGLALLKTAVIGVLEELNEPSNAHLISEILDIKNIKDIGNIGKEGSTAYPLIGNVLEMLQEDESVEYLPEARKYKTRNQ